MPSKLLSSFDFEELSVYDCTIRPKQTDKASHARILYVGCQEYADRWRELWDVFSREAVIEPAQVCDVPQDSDGSLNCHGYGSSVGVTATFGMVAANVALECCIAHG